LHLFILADCSGSMKTEGRMHALNFSIANVLTQLISWEKEQEQAEVFLRVIGFADEAFWHIKEPQPILGFNWIPIDYIEGGLTSMGAAIKLFAEAIDPNNLEPRALRPVVILITDGKPTDVDEFDDALKKLFSIPSGKASIRMAIAIGEGANSQYLSRFVNDPALPVMVAQNSEQIVVQLSAATLAFSKMLDPGIDRQEVVENLIVPALHQSHVGNDDTIV
jgi:uncharacterized protein YegL